MQSSQEIEPQELCKKNPLKAKKKRCLILAGPTAVGKTALSLDIAKKVSGEIISFDSMQVYRGMDIGTAKVTQAERMQVAHHMIDVCDVTEKMNVVKFYVEAKRIFNEIIARGNCPILVGGTGFYLKTVLEGIETIGILPDWELKNKLETENLNVLQEKLKKINPQRWEKMNPSDRKNHRRLIRAIEISRTPMVKNIHLQPLIVNHLDFCLTAPLETLYQRINQRIQKRIDQDLVHEIKTLLKKGFSWPDSALGKTIGYQEFQLFLENKETLDQAVQKWQTHEHAYAKRQITWFKKEFPSPTNWFDVTQKDFQEKITQRIKTWLKKK